MKKKIELKTKEGKVITLSSLNDDTISIKTESEVGLTKEELEVLILELEKVTWGKVKSF